MWWIGWLKKKAEAEAVIGGGASCKFTYLSGSGVKPRLGVLDAGSAE